jgi:hypothetical protein
MTAAWTELNLAMDANPIGVVVLALTALVGGLIYAYTHVKWFRTAVQDAWKWIKSNWPLLVGIFALPLAPIILLITHFKQVKTAVTDAVNWVIKEFGRMVKFIDGLPGRIGGAIKHIPVIGGLLHAGGSLVGGISHGIGSVLGGLQGGGPVTQSGPYIVGERGPEVVTLPRGSHVTPNNQLSANGGGGEHTVVIYNILDGKTLSKSIIRQGLLQQSRGG